MTQNMLWCNPGCHHFHATVQCRVLHYIKRLDKSGIWPPTISCRCVSKDCVTAAETPAEPPKPPLLTRLPMEAGALEALTSKVKQFTAAEEQRLLAAASMSAPKPSPEHDKPAQRWQVCVHSQRLCLSMICIMSGNISVSSLYSPAWASTNGE